MSISWVEVMGGIEVTIMARVVSSGHKMYQVQHVHHNLTTHPDLIALGIVTADYEASYSLSFGPTASSNVQIYAIRAKSLAEFPAPEVTRPVNILGTETTDMLPPQIAALTQLFADAPGPSGRGRVYNFPSVENQQNNGIFSGVYTGDCDQLYDNLRAQLVLNGANLAVLSRVHMTISDVNAHETITPAKTIRGRAYSA